MEENDNSVLRPKSNLGASERRDNEGHVMDPSTWSRLRRSKKAVVAVASLAVFIDMLLFGIMFPILPRLLAQSGVSREETDSYQFYLYASYALGLFVATPVFGIVSDRLQNRQIPMVLGLVALIATTITFAYVRIFGLLVAARIAQGVAAAATWVLGFAMVSDTYSSDEGLGTALGFVTGCHTVGSFVGPLIGGYLGEYLGLEYPFLLCAALSMLDLLGRLVIRPPAPREARSEEASQINIFRLCLNKNILLTLLTILITSCSYSSIELFISSWLELDWGFSESKTSLFMLCFIIPNAIMSVVVGWLSDRFPRKTIIAIGLFSHGLAAPLIPLAKKVPMLIVFEIAYGLTSALSMTPTSPHLAQAVEEMGSAAYARVYALMNTTISLGMLLGPWIIGLIKARLSFFLAMCLITLLAVSFAPLFYVLTDIVNRKKSVADPSMENKT